MPWENKTVKRSRVDFVYEVLAKEKNFSKLCREYDITRPVGYKWLRRYENGEGFDDRSRAPFKSPNKTAAKKEELILQARKVHPVWGARKLKRYLENKGHEEIPATSTISDILKRNKCIELEESIKHKPYIRFERKQPNELWQIDFKGHFPMLNNDRCHALTVLDDHSRYSLCIDAKANEQGVGVFESFDRLFREYGLPSAILSDNGQPWGNSNGGYTAFEVLLMKLNILPIHGRPRHPQTQGKEERFHRTLLAELLKRNIFLDLDDAQEGFNHWRNEYNNERPHEALKLDVPANHYKASKIQMPDKIKEPEYDNCRTLKKITNKGNLSINNKKYFLSDSFIGKYIELIDCEKDVLKLCYGDFTVAKIDLRQQLIISKTIQRR